MSWVKLDDQWYDDPRFGRVGCGAELLFYRGLGFCGRHLTDGLIPYVDTERLLVGITGSPADKLLWPKDLCREGLWSEERSAGGYKVSNYLNQNPSREQVETERTKNLARKRRGLKIVNNRRAQQS